MQVQTDTSDGWVAQLAEQWTENLVFAPRERIVPSHGCEHPRPKKNKRDRDTVNTMSTALAHGVKSCKGRAKIVFDCRTGDNPAMM